MTEFNFDTVFDETMQTHNLDTVVILGHLNPDGDAAGSVMSLAHYIHVNYPQYRVFPYLAKTLERGPKKMVVEDKIFVPFEMPDISGKQYCVIVCDNATLERMIGLEYYQNAAASIVIDHHASNEGYGDVNWTKVSEACAENVYHMLSSELLLNAAQKEAYPNAADYIYLGILHDTGGLARANQGIFQAVADLMAMGVDHGRIMKTLHSDTLDILYKRADILHGAVRAMDGRVAYVIMGQKEIAEKDITYEDIHCISTILRDCDDIELGFTMYEEEENGWRCSFRSDGKWINVNELLKPFGGGGHISAAGLKYQTDNVEELKKQILEAQTLVVVEDLYRPYRPKRRTRATIAKEKGLEPLANIILLQMTDKSLEEEAKAFVSEEKEVATVEEAISGAKDIVAESISDKADYRSEIRERTFRKGMLVSTAKKPEETSVYEKYYEYEERVEKMPGHRVLAINRGEKEKFLGVKIEAPTEEILGYLQREIITRKNPNTQDVLKEAIEDSYNRLIAPAIEREIRNSMTEKAEDESIKVFKKNLQQLLMQPPIVGKVVLGWDPAFRTGCKLAVVDETGKVLDTVVIYPTAPTTPAKIASAKETLKKLIKKYNISLISLGNGTASRESEQIIVELLKEIPEKVQYVITNEAGASVYSASKLATEEFPNFDVGQRSAASIARRLQDPLAELVKIDPKSIGVGQYQHDMNQKKLGEALSGVVEDCVNKVGVDLNTASVSLLEYVSGISKAIAKNIVLYREENGEFKDRKELLKVAKLGPKAFEQCAGFLRIRGGKNPLDATSVHPESYEAAEKLLADMGMKPEDIFQGATVYYIKDYVQMAKKLGVGEMTLRDIVKELTKPGRDPREEMPKPILRTDVLDMKDLKEGMILKGTVRNVIDFGAFVDIGVHQDGLVHISEMTERFIKHPLEAVSVGDVVDVKVLGVDMKKKRISLTMKGIQ